MAAYVQRVSVLPGPGTAPRANAAIKVVLADDRQIARRNLRLLLEREGDVEVIAEAGDLFTAMRHVNGHVPRVLLLDLQMPNGSSIEVIRRLRVQVPETKVIVLSTEDSPVFVQQALDAGAAGYLLADDRETELALAVRCAARGETYLSPRVALRLDARRRAIEGDGLSPRETEVLRLTALGFTSAEISAKLHLSTRTIESHRRRIHRKLGLARRSELVSYALRFHMIGYP
jgi:two-component system, NarL family, response regulator NreC